MQRQNKFLQGIAIPHFAFLSVIFGLMLVSFPLGMFVVFHSDIGDEINSELPLGALWMTDGTDSWFLSDVELGDAFLVLWSLYAVLFAIATLGPKTGFIRTMSPNISRGTVDARSNYMLAVTTWFSVTILVSAIIVFIQDGFGIVTVPPDTDNDLVQFFHLSMSPLIEEVGFRVILIGLPLFAFFSGRTSVRYFFRSLWHPGGVLPVYGSKKPLVLIILVGVLFGAAHVLMGSPWSEGKFVQAAAAGIILGWVYFRYGFIAAVLLHWATNYFVFAYVNFLAQVNESTVDEAFSHSLIITVEILLLISGILALAVMIGRYVDSRRERSLEL